MSKKVEVSKINIKIGDKEIPLTLGEAKELQELLNKTFGEEKTVYVPGRSYPVTIPYPIPYQPYRPYWEITWDSGIENEMTYSLSDTSHVV